MASPKQRVRKVPQRTCVGCRGSADKRELVRVVRRPTGEVEIDPTLRAAGRGAYLHKRRECLDKARRRGALERALGSDLSSEVYAALGQTFETQ